MRALPAPEMAAHTGPSGRAPDKPDSSGYGDAPSAWFLRQPQTSAAPGLCAPESAPAAGSLRLPAAPAG